MKMWKKAAALMMALGMTVGFTACGGSSKDDPESVTSEEPNASEELAGEQLQGEGAWAAAWENTFTATNMTVQGTNSYSTLFNNGDWAEFSNKGTVMLADEKIYSEFMYSRQDDMTGQGYGTRDESGVEKSYYGMKNGNFRSWSYKEETKEWRESGYQGASSCTAHFALDEWLYDIEFYGYLELESVATYKDGTYWVENWEDEEMGWLMSFQFKFLDGKLYSMEYNMTESSERFGYSTTQSGKCVITYGNAKVGALPYEIE